jgi:hypothetical protein
MTRMEYVPGAMALHQGRTEDSKSGGPRCKCNGTYWNQALSISCPYFGCEPASYLLWKLELNRVPAEVALHVRRVMLRSITRIMMIHEYQESNEADVEEIWRRTALLSLTEAEAIISSLKHSRLRARLEVSRS